MSRSFPRPKQSKPKSNAGSGCIVLFGLPFVLAGLAITTLYVKGLTDWAASRAWVKTECRILEADIKQNDETSRATARYSYRYGGQSYESDRVSLYSGSDNIGDFQRRIAAELRQKHRTQDERKAYCYVNPDQPSEAVLYRDLRWSMQGFLAIFALTFPAVGAGIVVGGMLAMRKEKDLRQRKSDYPDEPWMWRNDWADKTISSSTRLSHTTVLTYTLWSFLIIAPLLLCVWLSGAFEQHARSWILMIFPLLWCVPAWFSVRQIRSRMMLGEASFRPDHSPVQPGDTLTGSLFCKHPPPYRSAARLSLRCDKLVTTRDSEGGSTRTETIWRHEESRPDEDFTREFNGFNLPVSILVPSDAPGTLLDAEAAERHEWKLGLAIPGTPAKAEFLIPIFRDPGAAPEARARTIQIADSARETLQADLAACKISAEFAGDGTPVRFDCPPSRFLGIIVSVTIFDLIWTAFAVLMVVKDAPLLFRIVWPFSSALIWLSVFYMALHRRKVSVQANDLVIHSSIGPVRWNHHFQRSEITGFYNDTNMSSGNKAYYRVRLTSSAGKSSTLVDGIVGQSTSEALVERFETWRTGGETKISRSPL
jgi:hypothetical protein